MQSTQRNLFFPFKEIVRKFHYTAFLTKKKKTKKLENIDFIIKKILGNLFPELTQKSLSSHYYDQTGMKSF